MVKDSRALASSSGGVGRGIIRNRRLANQVKDYSGLRYGKITPTDIDGLIDFGNQVFVFLELKRFDNQLPVGQRLAIERLTDAIEKAGKPALAIVCRHTTDDDIDVARCDVAEYRFNGMWREPTSNITVRQLVDRFLIRYAPGYVKPG